VPFDITSYDLVCAGCGIHSHAPYEELLAVIRSPFYHFDARRLKYNDARILLGIRDDEKWKQIVPREDRCKLLLKPKAQVAVIGK